MTRADEFYSVQVIFTELERAFSTCYILYNDIREAVMYRMVDTKSLEEIRDDLVAVSALLCAAVHVFVCSMIY